MSRNAWIAVVLVGFIQLASHRAQCDAPAGNPELRIRVAAIQLRGEPGGIAVNQAKAEKMIREAARQGARYILLPELYGLFPVAIAPQTVDEVRKEAQPVPGPLTDGMVALARELKVNIGFGMVESQGDKLFNAAVFVDAGGIAGTYRKRAMVTHAGLRKLAERQSGKPAPLPAKPLGPDEGDLFTKGTDDGVITWGGLKIGVLICADGAFDGFWKHLSDSGAQMLCWPVANSGGPLLEPPFPPDITKKYGLPMLFANHLPKQLLHEGNSQILDSTGTVVAKSHAQPDTIVIGDIVVAPVKTVPKK
jgi:predicted amidohydrolase